MDFPLLFLLTGVVGVCGGQLILTSNPDTNGLYCPGSSVTYTCVGNNVANGVSWVINAISIYTFVFSSVNQILPMTVINDVGTVRVISASAVSNRGINVNFSLTIDNINSFDGSNLTCKTFGDSSTLFLISLQNETSLDLANVSVVPNYNADFYLNQLVVTLSLSVSECSNTNYSIDTVLLRDNMTVANETIQCSGGRSCSKTFFVSRSNKSHNIVISRLSYFSDSFEGVISNPLERPTLQFVYSDCKARCESNMRGVCELRYHTSNSNVVLERTSINNTLSLKSQLEANTVYHYTVTFNIDGRTFTKQGNFTVEGSCSQPSSRVGLIVGIVIVVAAVVVIIGLVVAVIVAKFIPYKNKHQEIGNLDYVSDSFDIEKINLDELSIDDVNEMVVYKATRKMYDAGLSEGSHKDIGEGTVKKTCKISEEINDKLKKALQEHRRKMKEDNGNYGTANFNRPTPSAASYSAAGYASLDRRDAKDPIKDKDNNEYHRLHELEKEKNDNTHPPVDSEYSQLNPGDQPIQDTTPTAKKPETGARLPGRQ